MTKSGRRPMALRPRLSPSLPFSDHYHFSMLEGLESINTPIKIDIFLEGTIKFAYIS